MSESDNSQASEALVCECGSLNHVYRLYYDDEYGELHWYITIPQHRNIFQRIWRALGYIVGIKGRYGDYDGIIMNPDDINKVRPYLDKSEVRVFLNRNPEIEKDGLRLWGDYTKLSNWLLTKTSYSGAVCGGRVIDMLPKEVLAAINRIKLE